jgi:hypothetical protein
LNINEILGRLSLWKFAFDESYVLILTAFRADGGTRQELQKQGAQQFVEKYEEFIKKEPMENLRSFEKQYSRQFPTIEECYIINNVCIELAIIYFCQILSGGNQSSGNVSKNDRSFISSHLPKIKEIAFKTLGEQLLFDELCEKLKTVRDKMIGHADGDEYPIIYSDKYTRIVGPRKLWGQIPLEQFCIMLDKLRIATEIYMKNLQIDMNF